MPMRTLCMALCHRLGRGTRNDEHARTFIGATRRLRRRQQREAQAAMGPEAAAAFNAALTGTPVSPEGWARSEAQSVGSPPEEAAWQPVSFGDEAWAPEGGASQPARPPWLPSGGAAGEDGPPEPLRPAWLPLQEDLDENGLPRPLQRATCPICMEVREAFQVGPCGHSLCVRCAVVYVRTAIRNAKEDVKPQGVRCTMHCVGCDGFITPDVVRRLLATSLRAASTTGSFTGPISMDEVDHFDRFVVEATMGINEKVHCPRCARPALLSPGASSNCTCPYCGKSWDRSQQLAHDPETAAILHGSSKACPNCGLHVTHYHGHGCHHISPGGGCRACGQHFCYVCSRKHGTPGNRKWHEDCPHRVSFCKDHRMKKYLVLEPFPHDRRCGCPICPDCQPGAPCPQCPGTCVVCRGLVPTTPSRASWR